MTEKYWYFVSFALPRGNFGNAQVWTLDPITELSQVKDIAERIQTSSNLGFTPMILVWTLLRTESITD